MTVEATQATVGNFDLERYLRNSKKVDISDIDLSQAAKYPLSAAEIRSLTYMMDIESHTIVYLRSILSTCAIEDPDTTAFFELLGVRRAFSRAHHRANSGGLRNRTFARPSGRSAESYIVQGMAEGHGRVADLPVFAPLSRCVSDLRR